MLKAVLELFLRLMDLIKKHWDHWIDGTIYTIQIKINLIQYESMLRKQRASDEKIFEWMKDVKGVD